MYCRGAGTAAEYCTGTEECVVGSTTPVRRDGAELQGRGPRKCTVREQGPQQNTVPGRRSVWWGPQHPSVGGRLSYRGEARGSVLQRSRGRSRVPYGGGGVCGGVHNTRPSGGS